MFLSSAGSRTAFNVGPVDINTLTFGLRNLVQSHAARSSCSELDWSVVEVELEDEVGNCNKKLPRPGSHDTLSMRENVALHQPRINLEATLL